MAKPTRDTIATKFTERRKAFLESPKVRQWRAETREAYLAMAGVQWAEDELNQRNVRKKPIVTINRMAPIVRAIAGYEIQNQGEMVVQARQLRQDDKAEQADVMNDAVKYVQDQSEFAYESAQASEDSATCGVGQTVTYFDYTNPDAPFGEVVVDRIYPGLVLFDNQCRKKNFKGARWAGYVELVDGKWLDDEMDALLPDGVERPCSDKVAVDEWITFIQGFSTDDIDILYHYEWWEPEKFATLKNPVPPEMLQADDVLANILGEAEKALDGMHLTDGVLVITRDEWRILRDALKNYHEQGGADLYSNVRPSWQDRKKYYKARIARGEVLDFSESWARGDFTIQYKTAYYDEVIGCWYGVVRAMLPVARLLNTAVSDYKSYLDSVPKGGIYATPKAFLDVDSKEFRRTQANEQDVTLVSDLTQILPKQTPQVPGGVSDFINMLLQLLPAVVGLNPDFLGAIQSGNMTDELYSRQLKQAYLTLVHLFESGKSYMMRQGGLFIDCVRILAENNDGMILRRVSPGKQDEAYFALNRDSLAKQYDIVLVERNVSDDERRERFERLLKLSAQNPQFLPLAIEAYPDELEDKQSLLQLMQPPPPAQPDPLNVELMQAEARSKIAQADKATVQARREEVGILLDMKKLMQGDKTNPAATEPQLLDELTTADRLLDLRQKEMDMRHSAMDLMHKATQPPQPMNNTPQPPQEIPHE